MLEQENTPDPAGNLESQPTTGRLLLITFGKPSVHVESDGVRVPLNTIQLKHLAALAYIALSPGRKASRQIVAGHLWGDSKDKDPRHGLRASLNLLRSEKALGPYALTSGDKEAIALRSDIMVDCEQFERLVSEGRYSHAVALYRGKFFAEWSVPGAEGFEDWANGKRQHYSSLFCAAASASALHLLSIGQAAAAARIAERLRDESPAVPDSWRVLLECRIAARDPVHAMADANQLEALGRNDEIELDVALRSLIRRARSGTPVPVELPTLNQHSRLMPDMVGREREFNSLVQAWERADAGRVVHARIESPAGLGKTRLLDEFAARLHALHSRPATVVALRGDVVHRGIEYGFAAGLAHALGQTRGASSVSPFAASVLVGLAPALAQAFPGAVPLLPPAHDAARMRASALAELATCVASERRLAILIDDVHWADPQSRQVISAALAIARGVPLLIVTSARTGQHLEFPAETEIDLPPLAADAVRELCRSIADLPNEPWVERLVDGLHRGTGGSPFLVLQALALIVERGALCISGSSWECVDSDALQLLANGASVVESRIAGLSHAELFILLVGALAAGSLPAGTLEELARERTGSDAALRKLEARGLIERDGENLRAAHDEIVAQAQRQAGAGVWHTAHLVVAERLSAQATTDPERLREIGVHFHAAGQWDRVCFHFERFVAARRAHGDRRNPLILAREFLSDASPEELKALVGTLPVSLRQPNLARYLGFAAAAVVLIGAGVLAARTTREAPPSAFVWALLAGDERIRPPRSRWRPDRNFGSGANVEVGRHPQVRIDLPQPDLTELALDPQHSRRWIATAAVADSGVTDLFLVDNGHTKRMTSAPGDDVNPSWSPDGRQVVFATSRWSDAGQTAIATLDIATGVVARVKPAAPGANHADRSPVWSPDGSAIAFVRHEGTRDQASVCVTPVDGVDETCHAAPRGSSIMDPVWSDALTVSARTTVDSTGVQAVMTIDRAGTVTVTAARSETPLGPETRGTGLTVIRNPDDTRKFGVAAEARRERTSDYRLAATWKRESGLLIGEGPAAHPYLDSLSVLLPGTPVAGVPHQLSARGLDNFGKPFTPATLRWSLLDDSAHARLSSAGLLTAREPGTYHVRVTSGGWRSRDTTVVVGVASDSLLQVEDWAGDTWKRWRAFGDPTPMIDSSARTPTLNVNGEGSFFSGVYTPRPFDAKQGFGVEVDLSTPVTMGHGQVIFVGLSPAIDSTALARWDHVTGWPQFAASAECVFQYPGGPDGDKKADFMAFPRTRESNRAPAILRTGKWFHVRLQILPDGRCVTVLNGSVIGVSSVLPERRRTAQDLHLRQHPGHQGARGEDGDLQRSAKGHLARADGTRLIEDRRPKGK